VFPISFVCLFLLLNVTVKVIGLQLDKTNC